MHHQRVKFHRIRRLTMYGTAVQAEIRFYDRDIKHGNTLS